MDPVAFSIFGLEVRWYGLLIAMAVMIGALIAMKEAGRKGIKEETLIDFLLFAVPVAIIFARLYYVIFSWGYYSENPGQILNIRGGGLAIHGAVIGGALVAIVPIWQILGDVQKLRILTFLDPTLDPTGTGYNVIHSKMAIGSGQMLGKGFFNPVAMSQLNYIPVQESDFIFAVTGETLGFWGTSFIILLFAALIFRMVYLATKVEDRFGSLIIIGVAAMMFIHIFENVGMSIGIMPVTGIPLPFFSYGGSSMLTNMMGIGLVECVWLRRKSTGKINTFSFR